MEDFEDKKNEKKNFKSEEECSFYFLNILNELNESLLTKLKIYIDEQINWIRYVHVYVHVSILSPTFFLKL
jgi:hypothetical protein